LIPYAGIDLKTVSASLGHAQIGTTGNIYAENSAARNSPNIPPTMR
jgi:site-specific recombinase XerD